MALVTASDFKPFSDWITGSSPVYSYQVIGTLAFTRGIAVYPTAEVLRGPVQYVKSFQTSGPVGIKIIPGDFFGVLPVSSQGVPINPYNPVPPMVVSLILGNPVTLDLLFLGGDMQGRTIHATTLDKHPASSRTQIVMSFQDGEQFNFSLEMGGYANIIPTLIADQG